MHFSAGTEQLKNGLLVTVPPALIVRAKSHFHTLPAIGVDLIIGLNGYIWISKAAKRETRLDGEEVGFGEESGEGVYSGENEVSAGLVLGTRLQIRGAGPGAGASPPRLFRARVAGSLRRAGPLFPGEQVIDLLVLPDRVLQDISPSTRRSLTRVALLVSLLARHGVPLTADLISDAHDVAVRLVGDSREGLAQLAASDSGFGLEVLQTLAMGRGVQ